MGEGKKRREGGEGGGKGLGAGEGLGVEDALSSATGLLIVLAGDGRE